MRRQNRTTVCPNEEGLDDIPPQPPSKKRKPQLKPEDADRLREEISKGIDAGYASGRKAKSTAAKSKKKRVSKEKAKPRSSSKTQSKGKGRAMDKASKTEEDGNESEESELQEQYFKEPIPAPKIAEARRQGEAQTTMVVPVDFWPSEESQDTELDME